MSSTMSNNMARESYDSFELKDSVSYEVYKGIINTFFIILTRNIIREGKIYRFPLTTGIFGVVKHIPKSPKWIDWKATVATGKRVERSNFHSDHYVAKMLWKFNFPVVVNPQIPWFWEFRLCRDSKREMAKLIRDESTIHKYYDKNDY